MNGACASMKTRARSGPAPRAAVDAHHIVGLGTIDQRMLILIDIQRLVSSGELALGQSTGSLQ